MPKAKQFNVSQLVPSHRSAAEPKDEAQSAGAPPAPAAAASTRKSKIMTSYVEPVHEAWMRQLRRKLLVDHDVEASISDIVRFCLDTTYRGWSDHAEATLVEFVRHKHRR